jgi:hypothetical protein
MKIIKSSMRVWITIASVISFFTGWALLAHANKPAPLQFNTPAISSPASNSPFQSFNSNSQSGNFPFVSQNQSFFGRSRLRTGGS